MTEYLLIAVLILLIVAVVLLVLLLRKVGQTDTAVLAPRLDSFEKAQERTERAVREEVARSREELAKAAREQRGEMTSAFQALGDTVSKRMLDGAALQKTQLDSFAGQLDAIRAETSASARQQREEVVATLSALAERMTRSINEMAGVQNAQLTAATRTSADHLDGIRSESASGARQLREEVVATLTALAERVAKSITEMATGQNAILDDMSSSIAGLSQSNERKLEDLRATVESRLEKMQSDNAQQLEQMRQTVDEKLQGTLEKRLGESFRQVSERLELVHKGLGEMQTLATGVGDLKKVLTNVKTRGTWGEVQLAALLEQVLHPDQYAANVAPKDGGERVEFAIRLPGQGLNGDEVVWLPIDAKFPIEDYQRLVEAQERADVGAVELAGRMLELRVKGCAKDISGKYLNPPKTTDFGILFLPIEGLFAEVIRRPGLCDFIQRECRVVIAGPTTLWSVLNSLQMGFHTLAIQQHSSEVWNLLAAVKTEWNKYGDALEAVQKKLTQASDTIDKAKTRSRAIGRKLRDVHELPAGEAITLLPRVIGDDDFEPGDDGGSNDE